MKLQHLNIPVTSVEQNSAFFATYFGLRTLEGMNSTRMVALLDENDVVVLLSKASEAEVAYPSDFHPGFVVDSKEELDSIYRRLKGDHVDAGAPERFMKGWTFYVRAPGGFTVQVSC